MISLGRNIRQVNDPLEKMQVKSLASRIKNPKQEFIDYIQQLRNVITIDVKRYRELKTRLPYVVAATFNPKFRKIDNFAQTSYFILDIDHLSEKEIDINQMAIKLAADPRVLLLFRSPSNDGLKVFFKTSEPFYDAGKYSLFYKVFATAFAREYSIDQVIDKRTSDVSRACFVSYDPDVYFNENAEKIQVSKYIDFNDELQVNAIEKEQKDIERESKPVVSATDIQKQDIDKEIITAIRERLNPKLVKQKEKRIIEPEELSGISSEIVKKLKEYGFEIEDVVTINYGKQFRLKISHLRAEVNVFYGKKGFSVVRSSKSGINEELTDAAHDIIYTYLNTTEL